MLKVNEDADLRKYGFHYIPPHKVGNGVELGDFWRKEGADGYTSMVVTNEGILKISVLDEDSLINTLFDMIKDGVVEKLDSDKTNEG